MMQPSKSRNIALLWLLMTAAALADPPSTHEDAVRAAASADADQRAEALVWIASHGTQDDAPLIGKHLTDDSRHVRNVAEQALWTLWGRSGDDEVDALLATGIERMQAGAFDDAITVFSQVIERKPDFAEGWNKRATALFLAGEYRRSLLDCDEVMKRNPLHFGALAGYGQIYFRLEQYERAIQYWKRALAVNPNMTGVEISIRATEQLIAERRKRTA